MAKPGLAILIGKAMDKNKDKMPMMEKDSYDDEESDDKYDSKEEMDEQMQQIAEELIDAIESKDATAVKDLLQEAFECMSS